MNNNGMSKKLCMTMVCIMQIGNIAKDDPDNSLKYAILIAGMCVVYKAAQITKDFLMRKYNGQDKEIQEN